MQSAESTTKTKQPFGLLLVAFPVFYLALYVVDFVLRDGVKLLAPDGEPTIITLGLVFVLHVCVGFLCFTIPLLPTRPYRGYWLLLYRFLIFGLVGLIVGTAGVVFIRLVIWQATLHIYYVFLWKAVAIWVTALFVCSLTEWWKLFVSIVAERVVFQDDVKAIEELSGDRIWKTSYDLVYPLVTGWMVGGGLAIGLIAFDNPNYCTFREAMLLAAMHGGFGAYLNTGVVRKTTLQHHIYGSGLARDSFIDQWVEFFVEIYNDLRKGMGSLSGWLTGGALLIVSPLLIVLVPVGICTVLLWLSLDVSVFTFLSYTAVRFGWGNLLGGFFGICFLFARIIQIGSYSKR